MVKDLNIYAQEYVEIIKYILKKERGFFNNSITKIYANPEVIKKLLAKKDFDTVENKLTLWRGLRWIDCESSNRFTKRITIENERMYVIVFDVQVFNLLNLVFIGEEKNNIKE